MGVGKPIAGVKASVAQQETATSKRAMDSSVTGGNSETTRAECQVRPIVETEPRTQKRTIISFKSWVAAELLRIASFFKGGDQREGEFEVLKVVQ